MSPRIVLKDAERRKSWPAIRERRGWNGKAAYLVDLGKVNGKRVRYSFSTKEEAETCAQQERIKRKNEGIAAFSLPADVRAEAARCLQKLSKHGVTLSQATDYYLEHVVAFREAPTASEIVQKMWDEAVSSRKRERTVRDLRNRLGRFAKAFGTRQLASIALAELEEWLADPSLSARSRINYATKVSQLYNYAIRHGWAETNMADRLSRPEAEDKEAEIFTVKQTQDLLEHAEEFGLLPYVAIGFFAGLRSAELLRLDWSAVKLGEHSIVVGVEVSKKRSRRVVSINDTLMAWIGRYASAQGSVVDSAAFRERLEALRIKAGIKKWAANGLRHSFGSYHLAQYGDAVATAGQMGHQNVGMLHNHYKALVLKSEAERFWKLSPSKGASKVILLPQSA